MDYWNNGGAWAGQHSASDFENNNKWTWFQDNINGGWFVDHDNPLTPGTVNWQSDGSSTIPSSRDCRARGAPATSGTS